MIHLLSRLFTPQQSNNYKAKTLHVSSLSILMLVVIFSQLVMTILNLKLPGVLGVSTNISAEELINLTNQKRLEQGLPALIINQSLVEASRQKASDMIAKNYWAHTAPDGTTPWQFFKNVDYKYLYAGENLARDFQDSQSVVNAWMNSPTHKDNILSGRYRDIGIVVIHDTFQGQPTTLVVQLFGSQINNILPVNTGSVSEAAEAVLAEVSTPLVSAFHLTKSISISLTLILLMVILIDTIIVTRKKIVRLSGRGLAHLIFLGILLFLLIGIQPGLVL